MLEISKLGLTDDDIKNILETNPEIKWISNQEVKEKISILKQINCNNQIIKNIIITNPFYLTRITTDINDLIKKLQNIGLTNLNLLFDSNPYLLNKDAFEIDCFLEEKKLEYSKEEIIDLIETNSYILDN